MVKRLTAIEYSENIKRIYNDEYELVEGFENTQSKVTIRHKKCKQTFKTVANEFTRTRVQKRFKEKGCPNCIIKTRPLESVLEELKELTNDRLELISGYIHTHSKVLLKCKVCTYEWNDIDVHTLFGNLKKNNKTKKSKSHGCPVCSKKKKKTTEEYKKEVFQLVKDEYTVIGDYIDTNTLINMKHNKCNLVYPVRPVDFLYKENRCPDCNTFHLNSRAVLYIKELMDENEISYKKEITFNSLYNFSEKAQRNYLLPFDFLLDEYKIIIEFDGRQHFYNTFGYMENFDITIANDTKKNDWISNTDYTFIRLHYKLSYDDIYDILDELITNKSLSNKTIQKYNLLFKPSDSNLIINETKYYTSINSDYYNSPSKTS